MLLYLANTIKAKIRLLFKEEKRQIIYLLFFAFSLIDLTIDAWTSTNKLVFLGTVLHFIDKSGVLRTIFLLLPKLVGEHSGQNIALLILKTCFNFEFCSKLDYFVIDNANNNNTIIKAIALSFWEERVIYNSKSTVFAALAILLTY